MAKEKLTAVKVRNLGPGLHGDGDGLWLRVVTAERRNWLYRYQRHGKARAMGLGGFPAVSLEMHGTRPRPPARCLQTTLTRSTGAKQIGRRMPSKRRRQPPSPRPPRLTSRPTLPAGATTSTRHSGAAQSKATPNRCWDRWALMDDWAAYLAKPEAQVVRRRFRQRPAAHEAVA